MRGDVYLEINTKELPKDYLILKLRLFFNNELYEKKIISYDIYNKMQKLLMKKMDNILLNQKGNCFGYNKSKKRTTNGKNNL